MKKCILSMVLVLIAAVGLLGQELPVLLTIADEQVTLEEFERIYKKNNNEASLNRQTPEEYLELFINFKLKVKEAEALGMDTTAKFINELEGYRAQLAKPYLADNETKEEMMQEAYERAQLDINASHILLKLPANPTPEDTVAAYEKITKIRGRIVNGEDFETVARATSDDASVKRNGGNLGYFTVFSMIYSFENVAYNSPVNTLSMPFRTDYGYHILNIHDKRPARGQIKVAHIFVRTPEGMGEPQKKEAYEKAQMIYDSLQLGTDFGQMAQRYSEDPGSARNNGEIPWFGTGRMIPEFEDACFAIKEKDAITKPFKSFYGWHIIKLLDEKGIGTYEEMLPDLQEKASRGDRGKYRTGRYISKLQTEYGFSEYPEALEGIYAAVDSSLLLAMWDGGDLKEDNTPLMKIGKHTVTAGEFTAYIEATQNRGKSRNPQAYVDAMYKQYTQDVVMEYEESRLSEKYPEFRYIYEEYHDGILLFDIMDQNVWSKAVSDTLGLARFHQEYRMDYMWQDRTDAFVVNCGEEVNIEGVRKAYKKIMKGKLDEIALNEKFCPSDTIPCITLTHLLVAEGENEMVDAMKGQSGLGPVVKNDDSSSFVILKEVRSPEPKKLDEARGRITSDYQNYLEEEWLKALKQKYPVEVDKRLLSRIKA
ncbi:MAG: peptidylprolyl isomerase [Bacteroidales bacterium]|nr:peptidylprolyl isomerase [Bacteroidales bacterium]